MNNLVQIIKLYAKVKNDGCLKGTLKHRNKKTETYISVSICFEF
jgi:hypothetical protein